VMMANITFLSFLLFSMCHSIQVAVNTWLNCSFFTLIISNVNPASIINFLFQEGVISVADVMALQRYRDIPQWQCRKLLTILHASANPQAFVQLYAAIKAESHLQWLIDRIDNFDLTSLLRVWYSSEPTGKCMFLKKEMFITINNCSFHRYTLTVQEIQQSRQTSAVAMHLAVARYCPCPSSFA